MKIEHMVGWITNPESQNRHCLMHAGGHTFILERWKGKMAWIWIASGYLTQDEMGKVEFVHVYDVDQNGRAKEWLADKVAEIRAKRWAGLL